MIERIHEKLQQASQSEAAAQILNETLSAELAEALNVLRLLKVPLSGYRLNVAPENRTVRSQLFGLYARGPYIGVTVASHSNPELLKLLIRMLRSHPEAAGFQFTSIIVNRDFASKAHIDRGNKGDSFIIALGDFEGGGLWVEASDGSEPLELDHKVSRKIQTGFDLSRRSP